MSEATTTGSTVPRRQLGRYLRNLRGKARLTVRAAAAALEWSEAKMWRIETGQTSLRSFDVETMCRVYGAPEELTQALMGLAKETKGHGWWHAFGDVIPEGFNLYIGLEEAASELSWYTSELVPGILQTEDYARALIRADNPQLTSGEIDRRVGVRMGRQASLTRATYRPTVRVVLNEAVIRRPIGSRTAMARQIQRLLEVAVYPNVSIRVVPFDTGLHHGILSGPFVVMRFPLTVNGKETEPPVVHVDGCTGELYLDKPNEIERYESSFSAMHAAASDEKASEYLLRQAVREFSK